MKKISVLTWTYRPGYIDNLVDSLTAQTFPKGDFEWILVDDLYPLRKDVVAGYVSGRLDYQHLAPRRSVEHQDAPTAFNDAVARATGELLYLMADYMYPHPSVLERQWDIFQRHGPHLLISGPLMDGINITGKSAGNEMLVMARNIDIGTERVVVPELTPPIAWPISGEIHQPTRTNLLTIWQRRFSPTWPDVPADWRTACIAKKELEWGLYENYPGDERWSNSNWLSWYWCGRNDAIGSEMLRKVHGLEENTTREYGADGQLGRRLLEVFPDLRYLVDTTAPAFMLPHPFRKPERGL